MKTGLPRHLTMTCCLFLCELGGEGSVLGSEGKMEEEMVGAYVLAFGDGAEIYFDLGLSKDIGGGGHVD